MASGLPSRAVKIVVTPGSGSGAGRQLARRVSRLLGRRRWQAEVETFRDLASLRTWAATCPPEFSHIVCIGGDTTQSTAAAAAIRCDAALVPVPAGFGNIFASVFGYPNRAEAVIGLLEHGERRRVDVGAVGKELFLSHRSYGLLEQVQQVAERGRRQPKNRVLRYLWYWGVGRRFLFAARLAGFQVEVDDQRVADDAVLVTVANVETYRGFLSLTPSASPIDGMFDVFVIPRVGKLRLAWRLFSLLLHLRGRWNGVQLYRGRRVVVTTPRRREVLRTRRRVLPLLVPPGAIEALRARTLDGDAPVETPDTTPVKQAS
jgi:diacylglycerol kinase (ATP)